MTATRLNPEYMPSNYIKTIQFSTRTDSAGDITSTTVENNGIGTGNMILSARIAYPADTRVCVPYVTGAGKWGIHVFNNTPCTSSLKSTDVTVKVTYI